MYELIGAIVIWGVALVAGLFVIWLLLGGIHGGLNFEGLRGDIFNRISDLELKKSPAWHEFSEIKFDYARQIQELNQRLVSLECETRPLQQAAKNQPSKKGTKRK